MFFFSSFGAGIFPFFCRTGRHSARSSQMAKLQAGGRGLTRCPVNSKFVCCVAQRQPQFHERSRKLAKKKKKSGEKKKTKCSQSPTWTASTRTAPTWTALHPDLCFYFFLLFLIFRGFFCGKRGGRRPIDRASRWFVRMLG